MIREIDAEKEEVIRNKGRELRRQNHVTSIIRSKEERRRGEQSIVRNKECESNKASYVTRNVNFQCIKRYKEREYSVHQALQGT